MDQLLFFNLTCENCHFDGMDTCIPYKTHLDSKQNSKLCLPPAALQCFKPPLEGQQQRIRI